MALTFSEYVIFYYVIGVSDFIFSWISPVNMTEMLLRLKIMPLQPPPSSRWICEYDIGQPCWPSYEGIYQYYQIMVVEKYSYRTYI
jgi:hypothetical protein